MPWRFNGEMKTLTIMPKEHYRSNKTSDRWGGWRAAAIQQAVLLVSCSPFAKGYTFARGQHIVKV